MPPSPAAIAAKLTKVFNQHAAAALARLYVRDQVTELPGFPEPIRGRKAKREMVAGFFRTFPDLRIDTPLVLVSGAYAVCEGTMTGTNTGPMGSPEGDLPPTGRRVSLPICYILKIGPDGLVQTDHTYFDEASFARQLAGPPFDEAKIRAEVAEFIKSWFAAFERCDTQASIGGAADIPDFFLSPEDGTQMDRAGFNDYIVAAHAKLSAVKLPTRSEQIRVLAPDMVLYTWLGAAELAMKDGSNVRYEPLSMTILLRRVNGAWKAVHFHESGPPGKELTPPRASNEAIAREFFAAMNGNDTAKLKALFAGDFSFVLTPQAKPLEAEAFCQLVKDLYLAFPDWTFSIEDVLIQGDRVAVRILETGTHKADYGEIPASGKKVTIQGLAIFKLVDGKIKTVWVGEDQLDFMQQLGMELKPRSAK